MYSDGHEVDGSWVLRVYVTDLQVERSLRVKGELHIGGVMLRLVEDLGECNCLLSSPSLFLSTPIFLHACFSLAFSSTARRTRCFRRTQIQIRFPFFLVRAFQSRFLTNKIRSRNGAKKMITRAPILKLPAKRRACIVRSFRV